MVRTRAKRGGASARRKDSDIDAEQSSEAWKVWLMDFKNEVDGRIHKLKRKAQDEKEILDRNLSMFLAQLSSDEANVPPSRSVHVDSTDSIESFDTTLTLTIMKPGEGFVTSTASKAMPPPESGKGFVTSTAFKAMPPPEPGKGFVTSTAFKAMPPPEPKPIRQSRAKTKRTRTSSLSDVSSLYPAISPNRRMTRSSSQPRDPMSQVITDYQTPLNKPDRTLASVTPKVDPYCPMPLKRYARQGEMAISLTGSPLLMTTSITEPNISLPLNNGQQVYSIMPTSGPCPAIPSIDDQTRQKLWILRENLSKILGE